MMQYATFGMLLLNLGGLCFFAGALFQRVKSIEDTLGKLVNKADGFGQLTERVSHLEGELERQRDGLHDVRDKVLTAVLEKIR